MFLSSVGTHLRNLRQLKFDVHLNALGVSNGDGRTFHKATIYSRIECILNTRVINLVKPGFRGLSSRRTVRAVTVQ